MIRQGGGRGWVKGALTGRCICWRGVFTHPSLGLKTLGGVMTKGLALTSHPPRGVD